LPHGEPEGGHVLLRVFGPAFRALGLVIAEYYHLEFVAAFAAGVFIDGHV
jgi:hypothetical protein